MPHTYFDWTLSTEMLSSLRFQINKVVAVWITDLVYGILNLYKTS